MEAIVLFAVFAILLILGTPIAVCLGISSILSMLVLGAGRPVDVVLGTVPQLVSAATSKSVLLAIPFFILGGNIMEKSGISGKLIDLAEACVGHLKGGVAMVCVIVACFFAAISGSGPATVAALGLILIPAMVKVGYDAPLCCGPHGYCRGDRRHHSAQHHLRGVRLHLRHLHWRPVHFRRDSRPAHGCCAGHHHPVAGPQERSAAAAPPLRAERWKAFKGAFWGLLMPVIILGGIYGGIFTPTEAAAVSAVYGLIIGVFVYRTIKLKQFIRILVDTASTTATVMFITAAATLFAYVLTRARIDVAISSLLTDVAGGNKIIFLLIVNVVLLIAGCFLDSTSALYIFTPLFVPVAKALGMSMVHFGTIMIVNLAIGLVTPPVGVNLYVACGIADVDLRKISKAVIPLLIASLIVLMLVTYVPELSLFLLGGE